MSRKNSINPASEKAAQPRYQNNINKSPLVEVSRIFRAPIQDLWRAWSDPHMMAQWWGPEGYRCPKAEIDFRKGGRYLFAMQKAEDKPMWSTGIYEQIDKEHKIVCTDHFCDSAGKIMSAEEYGMPGVWPEVLYITAMFETVSPLESKLSISHEGIPMDMHDDCVQGWTSSLNKLQRLIQKN